MDNLRCSPSPLISQLRYGSCRVPPNYAIPPVPQSWSVDCSGYSVISSFSTLPSSTSEEKKGHKFHVMWRHFSDATSNFVILFLPSHNCVKLTRWSRFSIFLIRLAPSSRLVTLTSVFKFSILEILLLTKYRFSSSVSWSMFLMCLILLKERSKLLITAQS